jgi:hypothetical protein
MAGEADRDRRPPGDERRRVPREIAGLKPLAELPDLEIADGEFDVRGWIVCTADDHVIGTVRDLLADVNTLRIRHLVVELGPEGTPAGEGPLVVVPIADVDPNPDRDVLVIAELDAAHVDELPAYRREELDRDLEAGLLRRIGVQAVVAAEQARRGDAGGSRGEGEGQGET